MLFVLRSGGLARSQGVHLSGLRGVGPRDKHEGRGSLVGFRGLEVSPV